MAARKSSANAPNQLPKSIMIKLNRRIAALRPSATLAADQRAKEMRAAGIDVISLDAGEPDFDTPERIKDAARTALAAGKTKYTAVSGIPELKDAIRSKLKRDNHLEYEASEIIASAGCKQALSNVIAAMFDEGDEVIIPTPAWVSFSAMVDLAGAKPVAVRCREDNGFQLTPEALSKAITPRTRAMLINSPSNPTGAVYRAGPLSELAQVIVNSDMWVLSDDTYEHIAYDGPAPHIFQIEPRLKNRGVLFNSLSKTYAMTGWRVGFAAGPKEVIGAASRLQSQNSGNPNSIAQAAAVEALNGPQDDVKVMAEEFRKRRQLIVERVRATRGFGLPNIPSGAFYVFPNVSALFGSSHNGKTITDGDGFANFLLEEAKVSTVGGNDFGAPEHIRMSYATSSEKINAAFDRIEAALKKLQK
jgi:aspartate aminotransferase